MAFSLFSIVGSAQNLWRTAVQAAINSPRGFGSIFSSVVILLVAFLWNRRNKHSQSYLPYKISGVRRKRPDGNFKVPSYAIYRTQGLRSTMEDQHATDVDLDFELPDLNHVSLFSIFDGHAGKEAAVFARDTLHHNIRMEIQKHAMKLPRVDLRQAIRSAFLTTDKEFLERAYRQRLPDGSTCVSALVTPDRVIVANIGDSRAILCYQPDDSAKGHESLKPTERCKVVELSIDDKPNRPDEKRRIEATGGYISYVGCWRVQGLLATSRSFGDKDLKKYVIADPQFIEVSWAAPSNTPTEHHKDSAHHIHGKPLFMVMATDGLWDVMSNQEVAHFILQRRHTERLGADELVAQALHRKSADNITVAVVDLSGPTS